mgnify:CR=1
AYNVNYTIMKKRETLNTEQQNKNSLDMDRQILVDTKELLYKNFPYIYNKFEIEKSAGSQSIDTNNYYINNFDI